MNEGIAEVTTAEQVERMAACLWEPDDLIEVRPIHGVSSKVGKQTWHRASDLVAEVERLTKANRDGYNIYVGANPRPHVGASGDDKITVARSLFADFDGGITVDDAGRQLQAVGLPEPTLIIHSGHGVHCYWRLDEPVTGEDVAHTWLIYQRSLSDVLGSDSAINNPERIMRLPGFDNVKQPPHVPCRIISSEPVLTCNLDLFPNVPRHDAGPPVSQGRGGQRPGDKFNETAKWEDILIPAGWKVDRVSGKTTHWTRPGKQSGPSGTTGFCFKSFYCFSSNAEPFEARKSYSKFAAYTLLSHGGNFSDAARELRGQGHGGGAEPKRYVIDDVELKPDRPKRSAAGKDSVAVEIHRGGQVIDVVQLTSSASGRLAAAKAVKRHVGSDVAHQGEVADILGQIVADAKSILDAPRADAEAIGPTVKSILGEHVPQRVGLTYRTAGGKAFSEVLGEEINRSEFVARMVGDAVLKLASAGSDAPRHRDGTINESSLITLVEKGLRVVWANVVGGLANQDGISDAEATFRQAVERAWQGLCTTGLRGQEISGNPKAAEIGIRSVQLADNEPLVKRVRRKLWLPTSIEMQTYGSWHAVKDGLAAWFRTLGKGKEIKPLLAMRLPLLDQVRVKYEGVKTSKAFVSRGKVLGVFQEKPPVGVRYGKRQETLAVLSDELTDELLGQPEADKKVTKQDPERDIPNDKSDEFPY